MEDGTDNHTTAQINKLLILYGCFTNRELYRYYDNLRYYPKTDTNPVVQPTLEELKTVFEMRGLPMPEWRRVKKRKTLWRWLARLFSGGQPPQRSFPKPLQRRG